MALHMGMSCLLHSGPGFWPRVLSYRMRSSAWAEHRASVWGQQNREWEMNALQALGGRERGA